MEKPINIFLFHFSILYNKLPLPANDFPGAGGKCSVQLDKIPTEMDGYPRAIGLSLRCRCNSATRRSMMARQSGGTAASSTMPA